MNQLTKQRVLCKSHHWTCSKGFLTVKAAASGDGLLAIHDRYAFQNIATILTKPTQCWVYRNKCRIQSLFKGPDLIICDQRLQIAFLDHLFNFMWSFSCKCLWHTETEAYHNRSKETLIQQHLFKAGSFRNPWDNPFQCKIPWSKHRANN